MTNETIHAFERAGLGKAPFRFVGMGQQNRAYGEVVVGHVDGFAVTTKPGGTCAFCGTAIQNLFGIESADGRRFHVGSECVNKTGDAGLKRSVGAAVRKVASDKRAAKSAADRDALASLLADDAETAKLAALPHPKAWGASKGLSLLDWARFMAERAGAAGRAKALKIVKASAK